MEQNAIQFFELLKHQINAKFPSVDTLTQMRLLEAMGTFKKQNPNSAMQTYLNLRKCLILERQLVSPNDPSTDDAIRVHDHDQIEVSNKIRQLLNSLKQIDNSNKLITLRYDKATVQYHDFTKQNSYFNEIRMNMTQSEFENQKIYIQQQNSRIKYEFDLICQSFHQIEKDIEHILIQCRTVLDNDVLNYLLQWKLSQRFASNGAKLVNMLPLLQEWFENLADLIWNTREQIKIALKIRLNLTSQINGVDVLPQYLHEATNLLSILITNSFVIERQPKQVTKTHTRY